MLQRIVSIIVPTFNRLSRLRRCLDMIRQNVGLPTEIIVVDGASEDGTGEWLAQQPGLVLIREARREGAVRAFNKGFRKATGDYVMWLNDDAYPLRGSVEAAVEMIERADLADVGMVALYHRWHSPRNVLDRVEVGGISYEMCHVRGEPYANFGLLRRSLLQTLGYADEGYYFFGFDPDLSLKVARVAGLKVIGCRAARVHHDEHHDDRKLADLERGQEDNRRLFEKWGLPGPGAYPDPTPAYLRMLGERGLSYGHPLAVPQKSACPETSAAVN